MLFRKERKTHSPVYMKAPIYPFSDLMPPSISIGYETNVYAFAAIEAITSSAARVNWIVKDLEGNTIEYKKAKDLYDLLKYPNEINTNTLMVSYILKDLLVTGSSYWEIAKSPSGKVKALYRMLPSQTSIIVDPKKYIDHFEYGSDRVKLNVEEVLFFRLPSPRDNEELVGFSPLKALAKEIKLSVYESVFESSYFKHAGTPSMILMAKYPFSDDVYQKLKAKISSEVSGAENAFKFLILDGNEIQKVELNAKLADVPIKDFDNTIRSKILAGFRVPENVIGLSMQSTKASATSVIFQFWQSVIIPYLKLIKETFNQQVCRRYFPEFEINFDLSDIEEIQSFRADISEKISRLYLDGVISKNEARALLSLPPVDEDIFMAPVNSYMLSKDNKILIGGQIGGKK